MALSAPGERPMLPFEIVVGPAKEMAVPSRKEKLSAVSKIDCARPLTEKQSKLRRARRSCDFGFVFPKDYA